MLLFIYLLGFLMFKGVFDGETRGGSSFRPDK